MATIFAISISFTALAQGADYLYVAATNVRLRESASTSAPVKATLSLGLWGKILEKSTERHQLAGKSDYWYRISVNSGTQGWIFGSLALPAKEDERFSKALDLINNRLNLSGTCIDDQIQLCDFSGRIRDLATHSAEKARLELAFLRSVDYLCNRISLQANHKNNSVPASYTSLVYYHESAGQYFVKPECYWKLAEKYSDIPKEADIIAWAAANQQLQGETEGDPLMVCGFYDLSLGEYIRRFPSGSYLENAFQSGAETFRSLNDNLAESYFIGDMQQERAGFIGNLARLVSEAEKAAPSTSRQDYISVLNTIILRLNK